MTLIPTITFAFSPQGSFDLLNQNQYFNGWPALDDKRTIVMAFPVEGWEESAVVTLHQNRDGSLEGAVYGAKQCAEQAKAQALAALSLDVDGEGWPSIGESDEVLGKLQHSYKYMRPSLFNSPYEATVHFIIGHRISMVQGRKIRENMAKDLGQKFTIEGQDYYSFPQPSELLSLNSYPGLSQTKIDRLHAAAEAALDGWLTRAELRKLSEEAALTKLETLPGVGPFFSQGILDRGAGRADGFTHDDLTYHALGLRYGLGKSPSKEEVLEVAEQWRPYRMWAVVLHHVWLRESDNMPKRTFSKR